jgi:hypothetical protein
MRFSDGRRRTLAVARRESSSPRKGELPSLSRGTFRFFSKNPLTILVLSAVIHEGRTRVSLSRLLRLSAPAAAIAILALVGGSGAGATTSSGNQNPDLLAFASLVSSGSNPDVAKAGDTVTATLSVTNIGDSREFVRLYLNSGMTVGPPLGIDHLMSLAKGKTYTWSVPIKIGSSVPSGTYPMSVMAFGSTTVDGSVATANITVDNG